MSSLYRFRRKRVKEVLARRGRTIRRRWEGFLTLLLLAFVLGIAGAATGSVIVYRTYADGLKAPEQAIAESTIGTSLTFDRKGERLYEYIDPLGGLQDPVPLSEISPYLVGATIATEDASFYGNPGVNFRGLTRAAWENLTPFGPGLFKGSGGSSITQQLVKNVYIDREERFDRKAERKIKETVIALEL